MDDRIVARLVTPTLIAVQLGALITTLLWTFYGVMAGVPALLVSLLSVWRALQSTQCVDSPRLHHLREHAQVHPARDHGG
jgi:uncharacterized membrane protein YdbT with pleckstrin-like domain